MGTIDIHVIIEQALQELKLTAGTDCPVVVGGEANDGANVGTGEGEVYRDKTGVTLNFRTLKAGTSMSVSTVGDEIVISSTAGGITGPDPSTLRAIATWADLTGTALYDNLVRIEDPAAGSSYRAIQVLSGEDPPAWRTLCEQRYIPPNGEPGGHTNIFGDLNLDTQIHGGSDPKVRVPTGGIGKVIHEAIENQWAVRKHGGILSPDADVQWVQFLGAAGANGGSVFFNVGSRNPEGVITSGPGSLYYRVNGTSSALYQLRSASAANTPWVELADSSINVANIGMAGSAQAGVPHITDAGGGSVDVAAGTGYLRPTNDHDGDLVPISWSASAGIAIPSGTIRYIGVEYNAGSPQVVVKTGDTWDWKTDFRLGSVVNEAGTLHILNGAQLATDFGARLFERAFETMPYVRANRFGGLIPADAGTRNLIVSAGELYDGFTDYVISAIDTSGADTFDAYYRDGVGGFTKQAAQTQWSNTQYDDGSGTLASLSPNRYGVHWLYLEADGNLVLLYGRGNYSSQLLAEGETAPATVPLRIQSHGRLLGRLVFQQNASTAIEVENVWDDVFAGSAGGGDVFGPASATDDAIVLFNGATGKLIQNSDARITKVSLTTAMQIDDPNSPGTWLDAVKAFYTGANGISAGTYIQLGSASKRSIVASTTDPIVHTSTVSTESRLLHEKLDSGPWTLEERGTISHDDNDTNAALALANSGTNPGTSRIYVGNRTPQSNVTGFPGDLYFRSDTTSSSIYQHRGIVSSNSDWVEIGSLSGPATSTDNAFAAWDGTGGNRLKDTKIRYNTSTNVNKVQIDDPNNPGTWIDAVIAFYTASNGIAAGTYIQLGSSSFRSIILSGGDPYVHTSTIGTANRLIHEKISSPWTIEERGAITHNDNDTQAALRLENTGTNPGNAPIYVGNRNPKDSVTAIPGSLYIRANGTSSELYQQRDSSSSSLWFQVGEHNVGFYAYRSGSQSLSSGLETKINYDSERDDPGGDFDSTTNYRFIAPENGWYSFSSSAQITLGAAGCAELRMYSSTHGLITEGSSCLNVAGTVKPHCSAHVRMDTSETMEIRAYQNTGSTATIQSTGLNFTGTQVSRVNI